MLQFEGDKNKTHKNHEGKLKRMNETNEAILVTDKFPSSFSTK